LDQNTAQGQSIVARPDILVRTLVLLACLAPSLAPAAMGELHLALVDDARDDRPVPALVCYPAVQAGAATPFAPDVGPCPVVVLGHATAMEVARYRWLCTALVADGYIVALPMTEPDLFVTDMPAFAADMGFLADRIAEMGATPGHLFAGQVADPVAFLGHSFGGGAATLAAADHDAAATVIGLGPQVRPSAGVVKAATRVTVPALTVVGDLDCVTPSADHAQRIHASLAAPERCLAVLLGGDHCQFAAPDTECLMAQGGCLPPDLDEAVQQDLALALIRPWLEWTLQGEAVARDRFLAALTTDSLVDGECAGLPTPVLPDTGGTRIRLAAAGPNPFFARTGWRLDLARPATVRAEIVALDGSRVRVLSRGSVPAGILDLAWDGRDGRGRRAAAGVYRLLLRVDAAVVERPVVLLR
jgi:predicted dienelactone hydrolase